MLWRLRCLGVRCWGLAGASARPQGMMYIILRPSRPCGLWKSLATFQGPKVRPLGLWLAPSPLGVARNDVRTTISHLRLPESSVARRNSSGAPLPAVSLLHDPGLTQLSGLRERGLETVHGAGRVLFGGLSDFEGFQCSSLERVSGLGRRCFGGVGWGLCQADMSRALQSLPQAQLRVGVWV